MKNRKRFKDYQKITNINGEEIITFLEISQHQTAHRGPDVFRTRFNSKIYHFIVWIYLSTTSSNENELREQKVKIYAIIVVLKRQIL